MLIARYITAFEEAKGRTERAASMRFLEPVKKQLTRNIPILGITGTGGAGKSSLTDELITRFLNDFSGQDRRRRVR